jgi:hypothetical protein
VHGLQGFARIAEMADNDAFSDPIRLTLYQVADSAKPLARNVTTRSRIATLLKPLRLKRMLYRVLRTLRRNLVGRTNSRMTKMYVIYILYMLYTMVRSLTNAECAHVDVERWTL